MADRELTSHQASKPAAAPLVVSAANPRYSTFATGDGTNRKAVYLTGSHIWNDLHDGMGPGANRVEWYNVTTHETIEAEKLNVEYSGSARFTALFEDSNPAVLYLVKKGN